MRILLYNKFSKRGRLTASVFLFVKDIMAAKKIKKIKQNPAELKAMVGFYSQQYSEVYFIRDMLADCIIAVECAPYNPAASAAVERTSGKRNIFGYQDLFFTTRLRTDVNGNGQRMVGYESGAKYDGVHRNDTRMSKFEHGDVPQTSNIDVARSGLTLSPFERAQLQTTVRIRQAQTKQSSDYEQYVNSEGYVVERFETFEIVRMK